MIELRTPSERATTSLLGRTSPLVKIAIAAAWLVGLIVVVDPLPAIALTAFALAAAVWLGRVDVADVVRGVALLWVAAVVIGVFNAVFSAHNRDPFAATVVTLGPLRLTDAGVRDGITIGLRVIAIAATSVAFARTTSATHLADSLVQQAAVPDRFAYGALAAYQAVPALADDLLGLRQARRIRGLDASWRPGVLVALLALAVRRGDRQAVAMDARGFALPNRTRYRIVRWTQLDLATAVLGAVALVVALLLTRL